MNAIKIKQTKFLRSMLFVVILCGLFASTSVMNINDAKAQDTPTETPVSEAILNVYQDAEFGFSFLYPKTVTPTKWEPIKDILLSVSLLSVENSDQPQIHSPEVSITIFENSGDASVYDWLNAHQASNENDFLSVLATSVALFADVGNTQELKVDGHTAILFLHRSDGIELTRLLIENEQQIVSITMVDDNTGNMGKVFDTVVSSFKFTFFTDVDAIDQQLRDELDNTLVLLTLPSVPRPDDVFALASSGYKLPWPQNVSHVVKQNWNETFSHNGLASYAYDFSMTEGLPVSASRGGEVEKIEDRYTACGGQEYANSANYVVINHTDGTATLYLHLKEVKVSLHSTIYQGTPVGLSGKVGWTGCGPHLHFQRQAQGGWWTQSTPIYFDEYPSIELGNNSSYKSQNALPDTTPPTTSIALSGTIGENSWYRSSVQFTLSAVDNSGGSGVSQTQYKIDSGSWQTYSVPFSITTDGIHTVYYKSRDVLGNWEEEASTVVKIDATIPTGSFSIQNGSAETYSTTVSLNAQVTDISSGVAWIKFRDYGQTTWSPWYSYPGLFHWTLPGQTGQAPIVETQFKDNAGNISAAYSDGIRINLYPARPSSPLYTLQRSTFGASGMSVNSPQYILNGTAGQTTIIGHMESSQHEINSGYWAMNEIQPVPSYPNVTSITRLNSNPNTTSIVNFTVTFSKAVTGVAIADFNLTTSGVTGAAVSGVSGSGSIYTVTVNTGVGNGTIRLDMSLSATITDLALNPLDGLPFISGETYTINKPLAPKAPVLRSPRTDTVTNNTKPTFWWTDVKGAYIYEIVFAKDSTFTDIVDSEIVNGLSYARVIAFNDDQYFWRVRAYDASNQSGAWSSVRTFTIDTTGPLAPVLNSPMDNASLNRISTFKWLSVPAAVLYEFQYDNDSNFSSPYDVSVRGTFRRPPAMKPGIYYWRVRAKDALGNWGEWSLPFTVDVTSP